MYINMWQEWNLFCIPESLLWFFPLLLTNKKKKKVLESVWKRKAQYTRCLLLHNYNYVPPTPSSTECMQPCLLCETEAQKTYLFLKFQVKEWSK